MATGEVVHVETGGGNYVVPRHLGEVAEQHRVTGEIQASLTVAAARPRNEKRAIDRIMAACQRLRLAEQSEYTYNRGGTDITGPTIDLLTVLANCWGNIQFGFRELSQSHGESTVECFAWDLETNSRPSVIIHVPHVRVTRSSRTVLTDPRDIYELVANNAMRRVRKCLEMVIPSDILDDAVDECRRTLSAEADNSPEAIQKVIAAFGKIGVSKEQIEQRFGRRVESLQPAQIVNMRRIWKSINDGISEASEWFEPIVEGEKATAAPAAASSLKDKVKTAAGQGGTQKPASKPASTPPKQPQQETRQESPRQEKPADPPESRASVPKWKSVLKERLSKCKTAAEVWPVAKAIEEAFPLADMEVEDLRVICTDRWNDLDSAAQAAADQPVTDDEAQEQPDDEGQGEAADDDSQELPEEEAPPPKRGRGRPPGAKNQRSML